MSACIFEMAKFNFNNISELDNAPNMGYFVTLCYMAVTKCGNNLANGRKKVIKSYSV